jgi:AraC family transcriptional regulator of adaptative response / methylphosphotriester-DNA alkyltransferase methyltransferase
VRLAGRTLRGDGPGEPAAIGRAHASVLASSAPAAAATIGPEGPPRTVEDFRQKSLRPPDEEPFPLLRNASREGFSYSREASATGGRRSTRAVRAALFQEAAAVVRREFSRPLTLEEVARRVATSPRQLRRVFSEVGGAGFRSFLTSVRMARARELLTSSEVPVAEVAHRVGYRQATQFTKAFERTHGMTPSQFRARHRGSTSEN